MKDFPGSFPTTQCECGSLTSFAYPDSDPPSTLCSSSLEFLTPLAGTQAPATTLGTDSLGKHWMALLCGEMFIPGKCRSLHSSLGPIASPVAWSGAWGLSHVVSLHRPTCLVSPAVSHMEAAASRPPRHCPACTDFLEPLRVVCWLLLVHFLLPPAWLLPPELRPSLCSRPRAAGPLQRLFLLCDEHKA